MPRYLFVFLLLSRLERLLHSVSFTAMMINNKNGSSAPIVWILLQRHLQASLFSGDSSQNILKPEKFFLGFIFKWKAFKLTGMCHQITTIHCSVWLSNAILRLTRSCALVPTPSTSHVCSIHQSLACQTNLAHYKLWTQHWKLAKVNCQSFLN